MEILKQNFLDFIEFSSDYNEQFLSILLHFVEKKICYSLQNSNEISAKNSSKSNLFKF